MNFFGYAIIKTERLKKIEDLFEAYKKSIDLISDSARKHLKDFKEARSKYADKNGRFTKRGAIAQKAALKRLANLFDEDE